MNLIIFNNQKVTLNLDEDGEPWFLANDVCQILGYSNPWDAIAKHVDEDDLAKREVIDSMGRNQVSNFINESGLYALIFGSQKQEAREFKKWVTGTVLPSIRKTGQFRAESTSDIVQALNYVRDEFSRLETKMTSLTGKVTALTNKAYLPSPKVRREADLKAAAIFDVNQRLLVGPVRYKDLIDGTSVKAGIILSAHIRALKEAGIVDLRPIGGDVFQLEVVLTDPGALQQMLLESL